MMLMHGYGTTLIKDILNKSPRELRFENTAYVHDAKITLILFIKLKKRRFYWNMFDDILIKKETNEKICEIDKHFGLSTLEFNAMPFDWLINAINPRHSEKATPWIWHLRLRHCRPQVIEKLRHIEDADIEVLKDDVLKSVECITCALSKIHQIINKNPTDRAIKSFQVLYFDLTINDVGFDGIRCITHFIDEFTSFNWIFFFINHKKTTLISIFKSLINQCNRAGLTTVITVSTIRIGQKTSIKKKLKKWVLSLDIK